MGAEDVGLAGRVEPTDLVVEEGAVRVRLGEVGGEGVGAEAAIAALDAKGGLQLSDAVVRGGVRAAEHERTGALGGEPQEAGDGAPAHGLGDDVGAVDVEVFEEAGEVASEGAAVVFAEGEGATPATGVVDGAAVALPKHGKLLPPGEGVSPGAVHEDDMVAVGVAVLLVVDAGAVEVGEGPRGSVRGRRLKFAALLVR